MEPGPRGSTGMKRDMVTEDAASGPHGVNTEKGSESAFQSQVKCRRDQGGCFVIMGLSTAKPQLPWREDCTQRKRSYGASLRNAHIVTVPSTVLWET